MIVTLGELKQLIRDDVVSEAMGALKLLDVAELRIILRDNMKIEEIITAIRIIKGVATVSQLDRVNRTQSGKRILDVLVTFDSQDLEKLEYVDALARMVKRIDDVTTVVIKTLNGQPVRDATGKRKLVY
jgi:hypothetical protein